MNVGDERSRSLWMDVEVAADAPVLDREAAADTVIIGGGIAGLSTAYELSGQGQKVIVLDRGRIGDGMTARTTAHLSANNDDTFKTFIERRGEELAKDYQGKVKIGKMDVDSNSATPMRYKVTGIPTLLVFKGGQVVEQLVGYKPKDAIAQALNKHIS